MVDYTIDGGPPTRQIQPLGAEATSILILASPDLEDSPHSVVITNAGEDADSNFVFGGLVVSSSSAPFPQPLLLNGLESVPTQSASIPPTVTPSPVPSETPPDQPDIGSASSSPARSKAVTSQPITISSLTQASSDPAPSQPIKGTTHPAGSPISSAVHSTTSSLFTTSSTSSVIAQTSTQNSTGEANKGGKIGKSL